MWVNTDVTSSWAFSILSFVLLFPLNPLDKNLVLLSLSSIRLEIVVLGTTTSITTLDYKISLADFWWWSVVVRHSWSLMLFWMLVDVAGLPEDVISKWKTLMLFWMLVDATSTPENADGRSKTLMLFSMLVDAIGTLGNVASKMTLEKHDVIESKPSNKVEDLQLHNL